MNIENKFIAISRKRLRFLTSKGNLTVEDLWSLPLTSERGTSLNSIAVTLHTALQSNNVSFVEAATPKQTDDKLRLDIVKHVIEVRIAENQSKVAYAAESSKRQRVREIIAKKKDESLEGKSIEELESML